MPPRSRNVCYMIQNIQIYKWPYRNLYKIISNFGVWRNWLNTNITSRNLKSKATQLFVQLLALNYYNENSALQAPYEGNLLVHPPHKVLVNKKSISMSPHWFNTLRPRQNGRHFADDIFKCIFLNENVWIPIKISLKFIPTDPINNIPALVPIMAWRRPGDKPLSEPMMVNLYASLGLNEIILVEAEGKFRISNWRAFLQQASDVTHWSRETYIYVTKPGHHWFR